MNNEDLDKILKEWFNTKEEHALLTKRIEKYKMQIHKIMNNNNTNSLKTKNFKVLKKNNSKEIIAKKNIPSDLWEKYSTISNFNCLYLSKNTK